MSSKLGLIGKASVAAVLLGVMAFFSVGCSPECVDKYDCTNLGKPATYTCVSNKCVPGDSGGHLCDGGTAPLPDGGC